MIRIIQGDALEELVKLPAESVHCCVTSPPYWGLRDYGIPPSIWGGVPACEHEWGRGLRHVGGAGKQGETSQRAGRSPRPIESSSCATICWVNSQAWGSSTTP